MSESLNSSKVAVVLVNLGTPDEPSAGAVRRYLRQFLSDTRVIEVPRVIWFFILNVFILSFRPYRVAKLYASIWQTDSPMRTILQEQVAALQTYIRVVNPEFPVSVHAAMTYGNPSLSNVLTAIKKSGTEHIIILPLFPQFSATSTAPVYDSVGRWVKKQRNLPSISIIKDYHDHPLYIAALAESIKEFQAQRGMPEKLLFSFHGIPKSYANKGDPYPTQCHATASLVAQSLRLGDLDWVCSFQSRFGAQEWVKPYTDVLLTEWATQGVKSVQVVCPAFSADCLETLEEIAEENKETFLHNGGVEYAYIPALNSRDAHIRLFLKLVQPYIKAHLSQIRSE